MKINLGNKIKAVIFDMDGVITNTMPYHFDAWKKVFSSVGIKVNRYDVYKREGQDGLTTIREVFKEKRLKFDLKSAKELLAKKEKLFKKNVKIRFIRGALLFIKKLKKHNIASALVTGTSRHEMQKILPKNIRNLFQTSVTGDEVKKGKPDPEPFLKALTALKLPASQAIVLENAPFGIKAAKRASLFCVALKTSLPKKYLSQADMILKSFKELNICVDFSCAPKAQTKVVRDQFLLCKNLRGHKNDA